MTDLGTYHVRVELLGIPGFIHEWHTGARYINGGYGPRDPIPGSVSPLNAFRQLSGWKSEDDLAATVEYMFTDGNYSCDCNKVLMSKRANDQHDSKEAPCGDTYKLRRLTLICPDGKERVLYPLQRNKSEV